MTFTIENGKQNRMSYHVVQIICEDKEITTYVHPKPIFSWFNTQFKKSFLPSTLKFDTVCTLAHTCFWKSAHSLIDVFGCAQLGLKYTLNCLL